MTIHVESFGISDVGLVRDNNEDVWSELKDEHFFILADGMGGHRAGEVAAKEAVDALTRIVREKFKEKSSQNFIVKELEEFLYRTVIDVNSVVYSIGSSDPSLRGMGTTLCCLCVIPDGVVYAHVGDSRIYRFRSGELIQLTTDHTLTAPYTGGGKDESHSDENIYYKNFLTRTIGNDPLTVPDVASSKIQEGDIYLLCSDGLTDMVSHEEIEKMIATSPSVQDCTQNLVTLAKAKGGIDNITVVVLKLFGYK